MRKNAFDAINLEIHCLVHSRIFVDGQAIEGRSSHVANRNNSSSFSRFSLITNYIASRRWNSLARFGR